MQNNMTEPDRSLKFLRQRKFLLFLPVLMVPFLTLLFWALGGGRVRTVGATGTTPKGLNLQLPQAHLKEEKGLTKLSFYEQSERDSLKLGTPASHDSYHPSALYADSLPASITHNTSYTYDPTPPIGAGYSDPNEEKVYQKLQQLKAAVNRNPAFQPGYSSTADNSAYPLLPPPSPPTGLEKNLILNSEQTETTDTQLQQLNQMMDKVLAIQHPEQVTEPTRPEALSSHNVVPIAISQQACTVSLLGDTSVFNISTPTSETAAFYGIDQQPSESEAENAIRAIIPETQTIVSGAILKLRLLQDITVQGQRIPTGNYVYGQTSLNNERLAVAIHSLASGASIYPVRLMVYDLDGLPGINVPGALTQAVAQQSTDQALQAIELSTLDQSLSAQAAHAGIQAAKNLLSKKVRQVNITLKAGYEVLLKDPQSL